MNKREKVFNKTNGRCYYCGEKLDFDNFHIDHIIPKSKISNSTIANYAPACCICNMSKGNLSIQEFKHKIYNFPGTNSSVNLYLKFHKINPDRPIVFYFEKMEEINGKK